jgi:dihydroorotate dehydrogenase electron transfer subunit
MLRAVSRYASEKGIKAFLSLEERMACGVGVCLGCVTKTKHVDEHSKVHNARVCVEGPVFPADEVDLD